MKKKKTVLIVGDSITAGQPGVKYTGFIKKEASNYHFIVRGRSGDSLLAINSRAKRLILKHMPDVVIIEAGTNDILLPILIERGGIWKRCCTDICAKRGSLPTIRLEDFQKLFIEMIEMIRKNSINDIIVTTIACVGEDISGEYNHRRNEYNGVIRNLAAKYDLYLADVSKAFDEHLSGISNPSNCIIEKYSSLLWDSFISNFNIPVEGKSRKRGFSITTDGIHMNRKGAEIFAKEIIKALNEIR